MTLFPSECDQPTIAFSGTETSCKNIYIFYNSKTESNLEQDKWRFEIPFDDTIRLQIYKMALRGTETFHKDINIFYNSKTESHID